MKREVLSALLVLLHVCSASGSLVLDSFTEGDHVLSLDGVSKIASSVTGPIGSARLSNLSERLASPGTTMTSTLSTTNGTLDLDIHGTSIDSRPLDLSLDYYGGGPFTLLGYSLLEVDVSALAGTGFLIVEVGSASDTYGPEAIRVSLSGPGTVDVPFDELNYGADGSIESFYSIHFTFEAASEDFSFVLDEIRAVPEPTSLACLLLGAVALLAHRRAQRGACRVGLRGSVRVLLP